MHWHNDKQITTFSVSVDRCEFYIPTLYKEMSSATLIPQEVFDLLVDVLAAKGDSKSFKILSQTSHLFLYWCCRHLFTSIILSGSVFTHQRQCSIAQHAKNIDELLSGCPRLQTTIENWTLQFMNIMLQRFTSSLSFSSDSWWSMNSACVQALLHTSGLWLHQNCNPPSHVSSIHPKWSMSNLLAFATFHSLSLSYSPTSLIWAWSAAH